MAETNATLSIKIILPGHDCPVEFELGNFSINLLQKNLLPVQSTIPIASNQEDELVSTEAMAAILHKSPSTLRNWVREGKISACRVGRSVFFNRRAVIEKIQKSTEKLSDNQIRIKK